MTDRNITDIEFDGIDHGDYPDYCDAYIVAAKFDGVEASEEDLDALNDESYRVHELLWEYLH